MLSKNQVVTARKAIESLYVGRLTIIEHHKVKNNHITSFEEVAVQSDIPCRLSFSSIPNTTANEAASAVTQVTKLFVSPEITIPAGSKLLVKQNGITTAYRRSGEAAHYTTHQEIVVELFDGWT